MFFSLGGPIHFNFYVYGVRMITGEETVLLLFLILSYSFLFFLISLIVQRKKRRVFFWDIFLANSEPITDIYPLFISIYLLSIYPVREEFGKIGKLPVFEHLTLGPAKGARDILLRCVLLRIDPFKSVCVCVGAKMCRVSSTRLFNNLPIASYFH